MTTTTGGHTVSIAILDGGTWVVTVDGEVGIGGSPRAGETIESKRAEVLAYLAKRDALEREAIGDEIDELTGINACLAALRDACRTARDEDEE